MMNRDDILKELQVIDKIIPLSDYVVVYGAALVLHNLKEETNDIDLQCSDIDTLAYLLKQGYKAEEGPKDMLSVKVTLTKHTDIFFGKLKTDLNHCIIDCHQVQTVTSIIDEKKARGREKDIKDVIDIENKLAKCVMGNADEPDPIDIKISQIASGITDIKGILENVIDKIGGGKKDGSGS